MAYDYSHAQPKAISLYYLIILIFLNKVISVIFVVPMSLTISKNFVVNNFHWCKTNLIAEKTGLNAIEI